MNTTSHANQLPLRRGDVVEVRSAAEILATLDGDGTLEGMLFMPEMLQHIGKRYTVTRRVEKICNTIDTSGERRMRNTVYLADLRCDGSAHGGCQAECKVYWKEAWLRRIEASPIRVVREEPNATGLKHIAEAGTRATRDLEGDQSVVWHCQATEALRASEFLRVSDLRQYWREATNGNFGPLRFVGLALRGLLMEATFRLGLLKTLPLHGPGTQPISAEPLNLQAGDLVQVRSPEEIAATLDRDGFNRRLSFDREMLPYCGRTFRVRARVNRIIDESTGVMLNIPRDCIILDGLVCSGERSVGRWFCPREIYPFWREAWLRKVEHSPSAHGGTSAS